MAFFVQAMLCKVSSSYVELNHSETVTLFPSSITINTTPNSKTKVATINVTPGYYSITPSISVSGSGWVWCLYFYEKGTTTKVFNWDYPTRPDVDRMGNNGNYNFWSESGEIDVYLMEVMSGGGVASSGTITLNSSTTSSMIKKYVLKTWKYIKIYELKEIGNKATGISFGRLPTGERRNWE